MEQFQEFLNEVFPGVTFPLALAMSVILVLILILSVISIIVSICLSISYIKYNRRKNCIGLSGQDIARKVLDMNGLQNIKVTATGSILFGNSYSHYFKKVRLRRWTYKKSSVSSLAMAVQKSALAILDKEKDPDMRKRVRLVPLISFGPFAFIPLVIVGVLLDYFVFASSGACTLACSLIGLVFYLFALILSLKVIKTEKKAQARSLVIMRDERLASEDEIKLCEKLFKLYNIEYVNNMLLALLELVLRVLQVVSLFSNSSSSSN